MNWPKKIRDAAPFRIIYADPPWPEIGGRAGIANPTSNFAPDVNGFATLNAQQIQSIPVADIAARSSVCLLWTTFRHLAVAVNVLNAWGFEYRSEAFVWVKMSKQNRPIYGLAYDLGSCAEVCLLGTRGRRFGKLPDPIIFEPRSRTFQKPASARAAIERAFPRMSKIELFARERHDGWSVWGDEV